MSALEEENLRLRRSTPPAPRVETPPVVEDEPDWESMIFTDPKAALELRDARLEKKITTQLTRQYQQNQGETRFWNDFYKANNDLDRDNEHDLVAATLQSNMAILSDMPTDQAIEKLGDLTRQRIMRYSKQSGKKRVRRMAEGAAPPTPVRSKKADDDNKVTSISSIIRARKAQKQRAITAA